MYTLGIPNRQYRRTTQVLGPALANPISYDVVKQDDGFYMFSFPDVDEYEFRDLVLLLKNNGVTTIGADETLTERNIMKLTSLLKEQGSPDENNLFDELTLWLEKVRENEPVSTYGGGSIAGEKNERTNQYELDIEQMLEDYEEDLGGDAIAMGVDDARDMQEQNIDSKNPDRDPWQDLYDKQNPNDPKAIPGKHFPSGKITKVKKLKMSDIEDEVTIDQKYPSCYDSGDKCLDDVTISWGNESHTISFEYDGMIDDYENKGFDVEFAADSDDGRWQFILDVQGAAGMLDDSGGYIGECNPCIEGYDWEELIIQDHPDLDGDDDEDLRLEPEDNEYEDGTPFYGDNDDLGLEPETLQERFQKLAGIKNK